MNILTFNYEYPPLGGGGGVVHALIVEELAKRHRVVVITSAFQDLPTREVREGVEIHRVPILGRKDASAASLVSLLSFPLTAWAKAYQLMRRERFDIINSHFAVPTGPASLPPAKLAGIPHVLSLHGGDIYDPSKKLSPHRLRGVRSVVNWTLKSSDAVVAQSTNTRENTYKYYSYDGPIEIIPLGIRQPLFPEASRSQLGLPSDRFIAITVGRLVKRKGIDQLLQALARPECQEALLYVVGDGPERAPLTALSKELGLEDRVVFTGRVEEDHKWQLLECADAYVSATLHEGFGLVYLEGMAAGLPVVTFDHGGQVDFLRHDETGYVVPAGDVAGLAAAISRLMANPEEVERFRATNLERAPEHRIEECAEGYEDLFNRVTAEGKHAATLVTA
jgi:glycosyltransferase involved in cell wall biosynthesis